MKPEPGKRIVSKGRYAIQITQKAVWSALGVILFMVSFILLLGACLLVPKAFSANNPLLGVIIGIVMLGAALHIYLSSLDTIKKVKSVATGIPLTRANIADLPLPDSLVRASQEPLQAQKTILLRAASEKPETHEEELLRASAGERIGKVV